ncbi:MAG: thiamine ABC transporter substrate-binding protein [Actinomycetota bacterium]|jgi:thiamine transport system substrate-binding protein|nr:thiamine ABC transporter substrate-binding protein [Actinomycetota bacterium]
MRRAFRLCSALIAAGLLAAACGSDSADESGQAPEETENEEVSITLVSHDSFLVTEALLTQFTADTGITVELLPAGDAGEALNKSILSKGNPLGDVFFGVDNTFLSRALDADIFLPYASPLLADIPDEFELDPTHHLLPVDFGDVCLNYDVAYFDDGQTAPVELADLTSDALAGTLVVQNPATSSPGLAFVLATIDEFGEDGDYTWLDYWADLRDNDVSVQTGWTEAYYGDFTVGGGGDRPLVVSYASSPPAEVIFADPPITEAPTAVVVDSCFRQIEFVGVLDGTEHETAARELVDFLLAVPLQEDIPLNMFVFPANEQAAVPQVFVDHTTVPTNSRSLDPAVIEANRERWIQEWTQVVLR